MGELNEIAMTEKGLELVGVGQFLDPAEAQVARAALEAAGIDVVMQGEESNNLYPGAFSAKLLVKREDEAAAREVLETDGSALAEAAVLAGEQPGGPQE